VTVPDYLTPAEVADLLRLAPQTLTNMRHKGGGPPFVKVGQAVRYPRQPLERWIAERTFTRTHDRVAS
jgi:excisionase family DNA binding protein